MKINIKACALTCGILFGGGLFLLTLWLVVRGVHEPVIFELIYPGYSVSGLGSLLGLFYGFIDGAIFGILFGLLYNFLSGLQVRT